MTTGSPQLPNRESKTRLASPGVIVSVRGSVVVIRFDGHLPPIYSVLRAGPEKQIVIEVQAQCDAHHVRGIALTPTQGLARGMDASRLAAMERADRNIDELLENLHGTFHRLRQSGIDEELFDVISGFEALAGPRQQPGRR